MSNNDLKDVPEVPVTLPPPRFANPFAGLKGDPTAATVNCILPKEAFVRVKQCRLEGGTIQTTMNHLWIKLIDLLERKQIYGYESVREFEDAVKRSVLVLPEEITALVSGGSAGASPNPAAHGGDDAGSTERIRNTATSESQQSNNAGDAATSGGGGSEGKPTKKRGKGRKNA